MIGSPALRPDKEPRPDEGPPFFWASQNYQIQSFWKQSLMGCPDVSIPIYFFNTTSDIGTGFELNATCAEYFKSVDPCLEIECNENASCISKSNSFVCECNDGYTSISGSIDSSGEFSNLYSPDNAFFNSQ